MQKKIDKNIARLRRTKKLRSKIKSLSRSYLIVYRSLRHIYVQLISTEGKVLTSANSNEKQFKERYMGNISASEAVGKLIAERLNNINVTEIIFDRSGYKYHGRVKALAEAIRKNGIKF